jgi:2-iminobutanoate/2-iminopropanoate deaminase
MAFWDWKRWEREIDFLVDLDEWPRFNTVYEEIMPAPRPVRTAVGSTLLMTLKVELEMWAVSPK